MKNVVHGLVFALKLPRWRRALLIAALSDTLGFGAALVPPAPWLLDAVTAGLLFAVLGFRWSLLSVLVIEAVPVLQLFPAWTLVVAALAAMDARRARESAEVDGPGDQLTTVACLLALPGALMFGSIILGSGPLG